MLPALLAPVLGDVVRKLLDRAIPDPAARARAELELREAEREGTFAQRAELAMAQAQASTNTAEASSAGLWRGGWRPAVGWTCAAALALQFVAAPVVQWGAQIAGQPVPAMPQLDGVLWELLFGMLGMSALRTVERLRGKA